MAKTLLQTLLVVLVLCGATLVAGPAREGEWAQLYDQVTPLLDRSGQPFEVAVAERAPQLVLIGNSVLDNAVDAELLGELTGLSSYSFAIPGSASAMWYMMLKQGVIATGHRPRYVVLMFRDAYLTVPGYRTTGEYRKTLNYFDRDRDPLLVQLAYDPPTNPVRDLLRHNWSLYQARGPARDRAESLLREEAISYLLDVPEDRVLGAVDRAFADDEMDENLLTLAQESAGNSPEVLRYLDFDAQVGQSFLPHMLRLADEAGIQLICVRFRCRRELPEVIAENGVPEVARELIPRYVTRLRTYIEERGVPLIDMSGEERLRLEHYADGDHLDEVLGKPIFTTLLAERLRAVLGGPGDEGSGPEGPPGG